MYRILWLILFVVPLYQLGIDLYLPSMPAIAAALSANSNLVQLTVFYYLLGCSFSILFLGLFSDYFGRRPLLLLSIVVFILGSLGCTLSHSANTLLCFRLIQGLGIGGSGSIYYAMLGDVFTGNKLAKAAGYASAVYGAVPLFAPFAGGYIQTYINWRFNFLAMFIYASLVFVALLLFLTETNTLAKNKFGPQDIKAIIRNGKLIITCSKFIGYALLATLSFSLMIIVNVMSPFIFQHGLHLTPAQFGLTILFSGLAYITATSTSGLLRHWFSCNTLIAMGVSLSALGALSMLLLAMLGFFSVSSLIVPIVIMIFGSGWVFPSAMSAVVALFPAHQRGLTAALISICITAGVTVVSWLSAQFHTQTQWPMALLFCIVSVLSIVTLFGLVLASTPSHFDKYQN